MEAAGHATDFRTLVETHQERVRNTCYRFLNNREDAEDVAQEVFIQVHASIKDFRNEAQVSTWIYRIAVNKSLDFIRKKKRKKRFGQMVSLFGFDGGEAEIDIPAHGDPHHDLEHKESAQLLARAVEQLPESQRTVITLGRYQGFSNKEIADIMDMSRNAVDALMHRAKKNLHKLLHRHFSKQA